MKKSQQTWARKRAERRRRKRKQLATVKDVPARTVVPAVGVVSDPLAGLWAATTPQELTAHMRMLFGLQSVPSKKVRRSWTKPHQGKRECERRRRQMAKIAAREATA